MAPRKWFNHGRKFCNIKCSQKFNGRKRTTNFVNCMCCGKVFRGRTRDQETSGGNKYCSPECRQKYCGITKTCTECGEKFNNYDKRQRKFCSRACYKKSHRTRVTKLLCHACGKEFERPTAFANRSDRDPRHRYYCSRECQLIGISGTSSLMYLGTRSADRGDTWKKQRKIVAKSRKRCRFCRCFPKGRLKHVDHIIPYRVARKGNSDPNGNQNLWVLCRRCHCRKTQIERVLYQKGVEAYRQEIKKIAGSTPIDKAFDRAVKYCESALVAQ